MSYKIYEDYEYFMKLCNDRKYIEAEILLKNIMIDVFKTNGLQLIINRMQQSGKFDYIGHFINEFIEETIAIELKISRLNIAYSNISAALVSAVNQNLNNVLFVCNNHFSAVSKTEAIKFGQKAGINVQFFEKEGLNQWLNTLKKQNSFINDKNVHAIIKDASRALAERIALHPEEFMDIEWRDLERIIATIFSDFGYDVDLTPSSKDGGKDVIVWYRGETYIIEIKHWCEKSKVGQSYIRDFLNVVIRENRKLGIYLSSSGYTANAFETLTQIDKIYFRCGDKSSMHTLFKMHERVNNGVYTPVSNLEQLLSEITYTPK